MSRTDLRRRRVEGAPNLAWRALLARTLITLAAAVGTYGVPILLGELSPIAGDVAAALLAAGVTILLLVVSPLSFVTYWLLLVLGQSVIAGLWSAPFDHAPSLVVTEAKTISVIVAAVVLSRQIYRYLRERPTLLVATGLYLASVAISVRGVSPGALAYGRNFVVPLLVALIIATLTRSMRADARALFFERILLVATPLLTVGSIAELALGTARWRALLNAENQASLGSLSTGTNFFGVSFERVGGLMVEPVTSGYIAGAAVVGALLLALRRGRAPFRSFLPLLGIAVGSIFVLVAAATKASLLMVATAVLAYVLARLLRGRMAAVVILGTWLGTLLTVLTYMSLSKGLSAVLALWDDPLALIGGDSTAIHLAGLIYGVQAALQNVVGVGLGVGGNFARNFDGVDARPAYEQWLISGSESAVGVLAYQLGLIGLVCFIVLLAFLGRAWGPQATVLLAVWSSTALLAESMFGPLVASLFVIGAALLRENTVPGALDDRLNRILSPKGTSLDGS